jgi:hypothetical protein
MPCVNEMMPVQQKQDQFESNYQSCLCLVTSDQTNTR